jgi:hypothetical protein
MLYNDYQVLNKKKEEIFDLKRHENRIIQYICMINCESEKIKIQ